MLNVCYISPTEDTQAPNFSIISTMNNERVNTKTIDSITEFVRGGEKHGRSHMLGVELEHILMDEQGHSLEYIGRNGTLGTCDILKELAPYYSEAVQTSDNNGQADTSDC